MHDSRPTSINRSNGKAPDSPLKSVVIIIDYFGVWPEWFPLLLASCRRNPTIQWHMHTDCALPDDQPTNVKFFPMTFAEYKARVGGALGLSLGRIHPYKICELRTACGVVFEDEIRGFDYFGYGDLDVAYGDMRYFYDAEVLSHDVISTHEWCTSGHLLLMKNTSILRSAFTHVTRWREYFASPRAHRFDEDLFRWVFRSPEQLGIPETPHRPGGHRDADDAMARSYIEAGGIPRPGEISIDPNLQGNNYFKEQFTTPLTPFRWHDGRREHPEVWFWKDGQITNDFDGQRQFPYLHFMNFAKPKALASRYKHAPWARLPIMHVRSGDIETCGVRIDFSGIHSLRGPL